MYRAFIKNLNALDSNAISGASTRVRNLTIKRDLLTKAVSTFELIEVPNAASEGDVLGVYDESGRIVYEGVISSIDENVITTNQILALFDDNWIWNNPNQSTIEETIAAIITNDFVNNEDTKIADLFSQFEIEITSETEKNLGTKADNTVVNFMSFLFDMYKDYNIIVDISIGFSGTPKITIGVPYYEPMKMTNNNAIRNLQVTTETTQTNKLIVFNRDGTVQRGIYYATTSGITTDSEALNRLPKINTKIVFSDDEMADIVNSNLSEEMFNHKISIDVVLSNKLYKWQDFHLGQYIDVFYKEKVYFSVMTGYSFNADNDNIASTINISLGMVRQTIESKLYTEFNKIVERQQASAIPTDMFATKEVPLGSLRVNGSAGGTFTAPVLPDRGYTIIGFAEVETSSSAFVPHKWVYANDTVTLGVRNIATSAVTASATVRLLEVKI